MDRRLYKTLIITGVIGASLMLVSFMLPQVSVDILGRDYYASGFNLVEGKMIDEYRSDVGGNYFVLLPHQFPAFPMYYLLLLFGTLCLPLPFFRDTLFRILGIVFAIVGTAGAAYGYMKFTEAAVTEPTWNAGPGYGLALTAIGGVMIVVCHAALLYLRKRRTKPNPPETPEHLG